MAPGLGIGVCRCYELAGCVVGSMGDGATDWFAICRCMGVLGLPCCGTDSLVGRRLTDGLGIGLGIGIGICRLSAVCWFPLSVSLPVS